MKITNNIYYTLKLPYDVQGFQGNNKFLQILSYYNLILNGAKYKVH